MASIHQQRGGGVKSPILPLPPFAVPSRPPLTVPFKPEQHFSRRLFDVETKASTPNEPGESHLNQNPAPIDVSLTKREPTSIPPPPSVSIPLQTRAKFSPGSESFFQPMKKRVRKENTTTTSKSKDEVLFWNEGRMVDYINNSERFCSKDYIRH